jgi:hypothetical protein
MKKGFFKKLLDGDFGLAKTYWLYGALVGFISSLVIDFIESTQFLMIFSVIYTIYRIVLTTGVWRAGDRYEGSKIWAILAKIASTFGTIFMIIVLILMVISLV